MAIILPSGFNITNIEPVDSRFAVANQAARLGFSAANVYEGLVVFQRDNDSSYVLTNTDNYNSEAGWQKLLFSSGSLSITGSLNITNGITGSLQGSASFAISSSRAASASFASTASFAPNYLLLSNTGSFATTGSNTFNGNQTITGSVYINVGNDGTFQIIRGNTIVTVGTNGELVLINSETGEKSVISPNKITIES